MSGNTSILLLLISLSWISIFTHNIPYRKNAESYNKNEIIKSDSLNSADCTYKRIKLNGRVKFVDSFPDIKVKIVNSFPDLNVKIVSSFPDKCGEWKIVESFPDIKVQIVDAFPDLKIKIVEAFPGIP